MTIKAVWLADELVRALDQRIDSGEFPLGARFPTEKAITDTVGVSRTAAREAFARLSACGLLVSRRGCICRRAWIGIGCSCKRISRPVDLHRRGVVANPESYHTTLTLLYQCHHDRGRRSHGRIAPGVAAFGTSWQSARDSSRYAGVRLDAGF
ncbi:DNA-binding transcriptional MocR family regulator [Sphingomonas sp. UYAg733]